MSNSKQLKFKAGDKVICTSKGLGQWIRAGEVYTVKESYMSFGCNLITLQEYDRSHSYDENKFKLYVEKTEPNYREMQPTDLIKISIDGRESEVPLGDLVTTQALLGRSTGKWGQEFYEYLFESLGDVDLSDKSGEVIGFANQQEQALDYFFKSYYDKQNEKAKLAELIEYKSKELAELKEKLSNI